MKATRVVHGAGIEVACYGAGEDWMLRLSHGRLQPEGRVNDAFVPAGDIGFLWMRRVGGSWIASGMVLKANFPQAEDVREFLEWALKYLLGVDESVHARVSRVEGAPGDEFCASMEE